MLWCHCRHLSGLGMLSFLIVQSVLCFVSYFRLFVCFSGTLPFLGFCFMSSVSCWHSALAEQHFLADLGFRPFLPLLSLC